ncbi:hypothetical protein CLU79DRAFT_736253 [Phycomyces nitens]|nr:hypothetical protein CLU79DRAFT_736253 [Phycomyces nitens]
MMPSSSTDHAHKRALPARHHILTETVRAALERQANKRTEPALDGKVILVIPQDNTIPSDYHYNPLQPTEPTESKILEIMPTFRILDPPKRTRRKPDTNGAAMLQIPEDYYLRRHLKHEREEKKQKNREKERLQHELLQQEQMVTRIRSLDRSTLLSIVSSLRYHVDTLDLEALHEAMLEDAEETLGRYDMLGLRHPRIQKPKKKENASQIPAVSMVITTPTHPATANVLTNNASNASAAIGTNVPISASTSSCSISSISSSSINGTNAIIINNNNNCNNDKKDDNSNVISSNHSNSSSNTSNANNIIITMNSTAPSVGPSNTPSNAPSAAQKPIPPAPPAPPASKPNLPPLPVSFYGTTKNGVFHYNGGHSSNKDKSIRRSQRHVSAFGHKLPEMLQTEFGLPRREYGEMMQERITRGRKQIKLAQDQCTK